MKHPPSCPHHGIHALASLGFDHHDPFPGIRRIGLTMKSGPAGYPLAASRHSQSAVGLTLGAGYPRIALTGEDE
jgi:hypothetical protein